MDKQKLEEARQLAMSMTSHPVAFGAIEHTERAGELLAEMVKANEVLAREAHTWWTAARDAAKAERARCALRVALHSQYPIATDFDHGYDKARKDAVETLRTMGEAHNIMAECYGTLGRQQIEIEQLRAALLDARDCRTCRHFTTRSGGCVSVLRCVDGSGYQRQGRFQFWEAAPETPAPF